jgi:hypothetical protein
MVIFMPAAAKDWAMIVLLRLTASMNPDASA